MFVSVFYAGKAPARATVSPDKNVLWNNVLEVNFGLIHGQLDHVTFRDKLSSKIIDFDKNSLFALKLNDGTPLLPSDFMVSTRDAGTIAIMAGGCRTTWQQGRWTLMLILQ